MSRIRFFTLLTGCFLMASAAWADDLGYVDCATHPESTPVFSKARQTPDSLGAIPCGERFSVLVYGFVFSRIQTKDGKVGYVYSNLITADRGAASQSPVVPNAPAAVPVRPVVANSSVAAPAYAKPASNAQAASMPITTSPAPEKPASAQAGPLFPTPPMPAVTASDTASARAQTAPTATAPAQTASSPVTSPAANAQLTAPAAAQAPAPAPAASAQPASPAPSQHSAPAPEQTQPAARPAAAQSSVPAQPGPLFPTPPPAPPGSSNADAAPASAAEPTPAPGAASQPQPEATQPAPAPVREPSVRSSWERPVPGARQNFLLDLYSGYSFARFTSGGSSTNLNGGMGSFGYNMKPWLQIVGDSSYNFVTISGTKNTLYGNHFGGRFFYHRGSRWSFAPFVEALVGGSRLDTSSATVKTSTNCISYKAGGGIDIRASRHWEIRLINVDYYRTTFGAGGYTAAQNNYWASAGVVLRLFGSAASE